MVFPIGILEQQLHLIQADYTSLQQDLAGAWLMSGSSNETVILDYVGSNNLTLVNPYAVRGPLASTGQRLITAGSAYNYCADPEGLNTGDNPWAAAIWVKMAVESSLGMFYALTATSVGSNADDGFYMAYDGSGNVFRLGIRTGSTGNNVSASTFGAAALGEWYFVVGQYDPIESKSYISVNGSAFDSLSIAGTPNTQNGRLTFGRWAPVSSPAYSWIGDIGPAYFWNRILTAEEVSLLYEDAVHPRTIISLPTYIRDHFNDADTTAHTAHWPINSQGSNWIGFTNNTLEIESNRIKATSSPATTLIDAGHVNPKITVDMECSSATLLHGIWLRCNETLSQGWNVGIDDPATSNPILYIYRYNGSYNVEDSVTLTGEGPINGTAVPIEAWCDDNTVYGKVVVNGNTYTVEAANATYNTNTYVGLRLHTGAYADNFIVRGQEAPADKTPNGFTNLIPAPSIPYDSSNGPNWTAYLTLKSLPWEYGIGNEFGTAAKLKNTSTAYTYQWFSTAGATGTYTARYFVKKDGKDVSVRAAEVMLRSQNTSGLPNSDGVALGINTKTGESAARRDFGTNDWEVNSYDEDWWEVLLQHTTTLDYVGVCIVPAKGTTLTAWSTDTGTVIIGNVELYYDKTIADIRNTAPNKNEPTPAAHDTNMVLMYDPNDPACYPGTGTSVFDLSSQGQDGTLISTCSVEEGPYFKYFTFDGVGYIDAGTVSVGDRLQLTSQEFTIMVMLNATGDGDDYQRIIDKTNGGSGANGWSYVRRAGADGDSTLYLDGATRGIRADVFLEHTWVFNTIVWTGTEVRHFIDGICVEVDGATDTLPDVETGLKIGTWYSNSTRDLNGRIAMIRVDDAALTDNEVLEAYLHYKGNFGR